MSISRDCNIRQIEGRIYLTPTHRAFIAAMPALAGDEWTGKLARPPWAYGDRKRIDDLKKEIASCLKELQGDHCAYCGMPFHVTSSTQIEHIAPKGPGRYPQFMFQYSNLVHACGYCNGFEKKEKKMNFDTIATLNANYDLCAFNIVHPYLDDPDDHFNLDYKNGRVLISHRTAKGERSIKVFNLDGEPLTIERGKAVMEKLYWLEPEVQAVFDNAVKRKYG